MASLIYVLRSSLLLVARARLESIDILQPANILFAIIIKEQNEPGLVLPRQVSGASSFSWHEPQKVGNLEVIVTDTPNINVHEAVPSDSKDSDALYFGKNDKLGILLQYLGPDAWRTKDAVAHTSVHHHEKSRETFYLLGGTASIEWRDFKTGNSRPVSRTELGGQVGGYLRGFPVPPYVQHPVVASNGTYSIMLLETNPPNNTKSDHIYDGSFRDIFPDVIASYTQKTHGLSAAAKEAGSQ